MSDKISDMLGDKLTGKEKFFLEILIKQLKEDKYVTMTDMSNITGRFCNIAERNK